MEGNTIRLPAGRWDELSDEAEEYDFDNRSDYLRWLIDHREIILATADLPSDTPDIDTTVATEADVATLRDRVDDLEARLDDLESGDTVVDDPTPTRTQDVDDTIDAALASWTPKKKREARREAGRAALDYLQDVGRASKADFLSALRPEYDVPDQNDDTYWKKTVRPALQAAKDDGVVRWERGPPHEYVWVGVDRDDDSERSQSDT